MPSADQLTRVLLVDDDQAFREMLFESLTRAGYVVSTATCGKAALQEHQQAAETFNAVVMDVIMPDMDGIETLRSFRQAEPALPVIVMSGGGSLDAGCYLVAAKRLGAVATLEKPFHPHELIETVARYARRVE